jgi:hypothetical protein
MNCLPWRIRKDLIRLMFSDKLPFNVDSHLIGSKYCALSATCISTLKEMRIRTVYFRVLLHSYSKDMHVQLPCQVQPYLYVYMSTVNTHTHNKTTVRPTGSPKLVVNNKTEINTHTNWQRREADTERR